jgi:hypothetical protein
MHRLDIERRLFLVRDMSILPNNVTSKILGLSSVAVCGRTMLATSVSPEPDSDRFIFGQVAEIPSVVFGLK